MSAARVRIRFGLRIWLVLAGSLAALACSDADETSRSTEAPDFEVVERLQLRGTGPAAAVDAEGETRMASLLDVGGRVEFCLPETPEPGRRTLSFGVRVAKPKDATELSVQFGREPALIQKVGLYWKDVEVPIKAWTPRCAILELRGKRGAQAAISIPQLRTAGARRPWVILYVVDTLRFDYTPYAEGQSTTSQLAPALEALAADGIVYRNVFSTSSWTRPTVATLLTGLGPSYHRVYDRQDRLPLAISRLPVWLARQGWSTQALSSNPNVLPLWGFMPGFDRFVDVGSESWIKDSNFEDLTEQVLSVFDRNADAPLFLYVHDNEPHSPYRPADRYREMFDAPPAGGAGEVPIHADDAEEMRGSRALYRASIRSMSDRLRRTLDKLKEIGRYDDSLIVLVGDHGEEFGEHGGVLHGRTLYQEQMHVPLVIKPPAGGAPLGEVHAPASTESLAATILHLLDIEADESEGSPRLAWPGEEVLPSPIYAELLLDGARSEAVVLWPWKYIREDGEHERVFDLAADPDERRDLSAEQADLLHSLRVAVDRRRAIASSGLALRCVAGSEPAIARFALELADDALPELETGGLDLADRVEQVPGSVHVALALRPAVEPAHPFARFRAAVAARAQADRDELRLKGLESTSVRISAVGQGASVPLIAPDGEHLPATGEAIPLSRLAVSVAPADPPENERPACLVYYLQLPSEVTPDGELDAELRARLQALGYMQ